VLLVLALQLSLDVGFVFGWWGTLSGVMEDHMQGQRFAAFICVYTLLPLRWNSRIGSRRRRGRRLLYREYQIQPRRRVDHLSPHLV
jgi:hypothetical protein